MKTFWLCLVPLFVAVDAIGVLPLFVPLTEWTGRTQRQMVILQSVVTASMAAVIVNIILAGIIFLLGRPITRVLGKTGTKTISKLASLLLAAIAVMLMRKGITGVLDP